MCRREGNVSVATGCVLRDTCTGTHSCSLPLTLDCPLVFMVLYVPTVGCSFRLQMATEHLGVAAHQGHEETLVGCALFSTPGLSWSQAQSLGAGGCRAAAGSEDSRCLPKVICQREVLGAATVSQSFEQRALSAGGRKLGAMS